MAFAQDNLLNAVPTVQEIKQKANKVIDSTAITSCLHKSFDNVNSPELMSVQINTCIQMNLQKYMPLDELERKNTQTAIDIKQKLNQEVAPFRACFSNYQGFKIFIECLGNL